MRGMATQVKFHEDCAVNGTSYTAGQVVTLPDADARLAVVNGLAVVGSGAAPPTPARTLDAAYARLGSTAVADTTAPFYWAHRAGALVGPEEALSTMRTSVAHGADGLEFDVQRLADGTLVVHHDTTVDRATTGTGNVADFVSASWQSLAIDSAALVAGANIAWHAEQPPTLERVLREFGNRVTLIMQAYPGTIDLIDDLVDRMGVTRATVVIQASDINIANAAASYGFAACFLADAVASHNLAANAAAGILYAGISEANVTAQFVTDAHALGVQVVAYGNLASRAYRRDELLALGVDGFFADDALYLKNRAAVTRTTDAFAAQMFMPGHHASRDTRGKFYTPDEFGWDSAAVQSHACLGYLAPPDPSNYTLNLEVNITDDRGNSAKGFYLAVGNNDLFTNGDRAGTFDGYSFVGRANNTLAATQILNNAFQANLSGSFAVTGFALNTWLGYRLTVTPTTLRWERSDGTGGQTFSTGAAGAYRPLNYIHLGRDSVGVKFRNLTIT